MELQTSLVEESSVVILKNGKSASRATVKRVLDLMQTLLATPNWAFLLNDLAMKAENDRHQFFDGCGSQLMALGFLDTDGVVFPSMRDVIISSVTGKGADFCFTSPITS